MQELEQIKVNKDAQKKSLIGDGILLFVLVVGIILAVFAWFNTLRTDSKLGSIKMIANDNLDIRFNTYPGTMQASGNVLYDVTPLKDLNNPDFDEDSNVFSMYPGEKKYFKTVISNYETTAYIGDLTLMSFLVNHNLLSTSDMACLTFAGNLEGSLSQQFYDLVSDTGYYDATYASVSIQPVYKGISLPAGTETEGNVRPSTVTVYWYILLNGDAVDNEMMDEEMMKFNSIKFYVTN